LLALQPSGALCVPELASHRTGSSRFRLLMHKAKPLLSGVLRQNVKRPIVGCFHRPRVMMSGQLVRGEWWVGAADCVAKLAQWT